MIDRRARCWGGPLDGQIITANSPWLLAFEQESAERWSIRPRSVRPTATATMPRTIKYRYERIAVSVEGEVAEPTTNGVTTEVHYDLMRHRSHVVCGAWLLPEHEDDRHSRREILAGLNLVMFLCRA